MPSKKQASNAKPKTITAPVAAGTKKGMAPVPKQTYGSNGNTLVSHMEYIQDVNVTSSTLTLKLECNPQNGGMFTWLSAIATRFEMYRFRKLKFIYKPSCATQTAGYIGLGFDFDAYDSNPTKNVLLTWKYSSKSALWQTLTLDVSSDARLAAPRYCNVNSLGDKRMDFLGNFFCLTLSNGSIPAGELFVDYTVELIQPAYQLPPVLYQAFGNESNTVNDQWFANLTYNLGNMITEIKAKNEIILKQAGQFLISVLSEGAAINDNITYLLQQPAGAFASDWTSSTYLQNRKDGAFANTTFFLDIKQPPVLLSFAGGAPSPGIKQNVRIATYANAY